MSKKTTDLPLKAIPVLADTVTGLDSEDATLSTKDKVFTVEGIGDAIFPSKTTDDLAEGTNLYYTDTRVTNNTTVVALGTNKADKANVLELDNTTVYTPTNPYNPATKDYVDNFSVPDATDTIKGKIRIATDAESDTGTNELTAINPKQLKDRQFRTTEVQILSVPTSLSTSTVSYPHNLGVSPKSIRFDCTNRLFGSEILGFGVYDGVNNIFKFTNESEFSLTGSIRTIGSPSSTDYVEGAVSAVSSTTFTIDWTQVGTPDNGTINLLVTLSL